jgi:hypothetical protein
MSDPKTAARGTALPQIAASNSEAWRQIQASTLGDRMKRALQALASILRDLLAARRRAALKRGWPETPEFVFCSETSGTLDEHNVTRAWNRLRRKAQKRGVRPLRLHDARHTYASIALASGKSVRWVAAQLGHANPELTLRVYAHALREEESDLSFLDFGGTKRHPRGTKREATANTRKPRRATPRRGSRNLERETGIEPATLSLGGCTGYESRFVRLGFKPFRCNELSHLTIVRNDSASTQSVRPTGSTLAAS